MPNVELEELSRQEALLRSCSIHLFLPQQPGGRQAGDFTSSSSQDGIASWQDNDDQRQELYCGQSFACVVKLEVPQTDQAALDFLNADDLDLALEVYSEAPAPKQQTEASPTATFRNVIHHAHDRSAFFASPRYESASSGYPYTPAPQPQLEGREDKAQYTEPGTFLFSISVPTQRLPASSLNGSGHAYWHFENIRIPHSLGNLPTSVLSLVAIVTFRMTTKRDASGTSDSWGTQALQSSQGHRNLRHQHGDYLHPVSLSSRMQQQSRESTDVSHPKVLRRSVQRNITCRAAMTLGCVRDLQPGLGDKLVLAVDVIFVGPPGGPLLRINKCYINAHEQELRMIGTSVQKRLLGPQDQCTMVFGHYAASSPITFPQGPPPYALSRTQSGSLSGPWPETKPADADVPVLYIEGELVLNETARQKAADKHQCPSDFQRRWPLPLESLHTGMNTVRSVGAQHHESSKCQVERPSQAIVGVNAASLAVRSLTKHNIALDVQHSANMLSRTDSIAERPGPMVRSASAFSQSTLQRQGIKGTRPTGPKGAAQRAVSYVGVRDDNRFYTQDRRTGLASESTANPFAAIPGLANRQAPYSTATKMNGSSTWDLLISASIRTSSLTGHDNAPPAHASRSAADDGTSIEGRLAGFSFSETNDDGPAEKLASLKEGAESEHFAGKTHDDTPAVHAFETFFVEFWLQNRGTDIASLAIHIPTCKGDDALVVATNVDPHLHIGSLTAGSSQVVQAKFLALRPGKFKLKTVQLGLRGQHIRVELQPSLVMSVKAA